MLIVISPAKTLDFKSPVNFSKFSLPEFLSESKQLIGELKELNPEQISELMNISSKLGVLNYSRFANWHTPFHPENARPAIFAFKGDTYLGLRAEQFSATDLSFAQKHLRILSGLYGILKPLDLMQAYRLEMGSRFRDTEGQSLYDFWGSKLSRSLNATLTQEKSRLLINLASKEYFSSIHPSALDANIITPVFKDYSRGKYRVLSFFAKKARGAMSAYIIRQQLSSASQLQGFTEEGYRFSKEASSPENPVFLRQQT
ncbi:MAG: peroxide stress protein YaaA [Gammaproteobacteria bacterium]|jgi:hypothetical protein|nr:peroxide stress protein YaaA [Gammaproteobacteria bacterium]MDP7455233.1 peroxide stress protein YaaA [Gammaproteobacteria bacterium]|tara:strand:- start:234 stop:1007 length:774 start_codon:yes stop_codon:yes gene_type:complete